MLCLLHVSLKKYLFSLLPIGTYLLITHISIASFLWDICKQWRLRSDAASAEAASVEGLHCFLTER